MNSETLKQKRIELNLTQSALAEAIGKTRKTINSYENGANIPLDVQRLLKLYFQEVTKTDTPSEVKEDRFEDIVAKRVLKAVKPFITETLKSHQENKEALNATMLTVAEANIKLEEMENALRILEQKINLLTEIDKEVLDRVSGK